MLNLEKIRSNVIGFAKANAVWVILLLVAGFMFGRGCDQDPEPASGVNEKEHVRVVMELASARDSIHIADSVAKIERAARHEENEAAAKERVKLQAEARKASEKASYYQGVAKQADEANDTETSISARDSIITSLYGVIAIKNRELEQVDSIVYRKDLDIALLDAANTAKTDLIDRQRVAFDNVIIDNQKLIVENKALRKSAKKKKFWGNIWGGLKTGAAATGGFILGRAIK